jgi:hypothetical protein
MRRTTERWLAAGILALALDPGRLEALDLKTAAAEPNLVKRARLALANGETASTRAGDACRSGDYDKCDALLDEVKESVELGKTSLDATGIDAARSPRHFKDAEIRVRKILRLLDAVRSYVHSEDMSHFEAVRARVSEINDQLLSAIMKKQRRKK